MDRKEIETRLRLANDAMIAAATKAIAELHQPEQTEEYQAAQADADHAREELRAMDDRAAALAAARSRFGAAKAALGHATRIALAEKPDVPVLPRVRAELANLEAAREELQIVTHDDVAGR